jgi:hypothetical protein
MKACYSSAIADTFLSYQELPLVLRHTLKITIQPHDRSYDME